MTAGGAPRRTRGWRDRKPAERAVDEAADELRRLKAQTPPPVASIRAAQRKLDRAWRNLNRLRTGGY